MIVESELMHAPTARAHSAPSQHLAVDSGMWRLEPLNDASWVDDFDDCDQALVASIPTPHRDSSAALFIAALTPPPQSVAASPASNQLLDKVPQRTAPPIPTHLDCGIVAVGWGVAVGLASCVFDDRYDASLVAGVSVLSASILAAIVHGAERPYTRAYGQATPVGAIYVAAGYLVVGMFGAATLKRASC